MSQANDLMTTEEFAAMARVSPGTPAVWRQRRQGPRWIKLGNGPTSPVRYRRADVDEWFASCLSGAGQQVSA